MLGTLIPPLKSMGLPTSVCCNAVSVADLSWYSARTEKEGVRTTVSIETGNDIVGNLMLVLTREKPDMIVISTHGLSGWRPVILGSIAEQVIKSSNCTLLLLHSIPEPGVSKESAINPWEDTFVPPATAASHEKSVTPALEGRALKRSALELAEQGERTEQQFDAAHSIFTK